MKSEILFALSYQHRTYRRISAYSYGGFVSFVNTRYFQDLRGRQDPTQIQRNTTRSQTWNLYQYQLYQRCSFLKISSNEVFIFGFQVSGSPSHITTSYRWSEHLEQKVSTSSPRMNNMNYRRRLLAIWSLFMMTIWQRFMMFMMVPWVRVQYKAYIVQRSHWLIFSSS